MKFNSAGLAVGQEAVVNICRMPQVLSQPGALWSYFSYSRATFFLETLICQRQDRLLQIYKGLGWYIFPLIPICVPDSCKPHGKLFLVEDVGMCSWLSAFQLFPEAVPGVSVSLASSGKAGLCGHCLLLC